MISKVRRAYIAEHPVVFWVSLGIALAGTIPLVAPSLADQSPARMALPHWLAIAFNVTFALGGWASFFGIARGLRKLEAAGMALLASGLLTNFVVIIYITGGSAPSAAFVLALAIGCAQRCYHLVTCPATMFSISVEP